MSIESCAADGSGIFELSGISDMPGLTAARDKLNENGIEVTDGGHDLNSDRWLIETRPSIPTDRLKLISEKIGIIIRLPLKPN